MSGPIFLSNSPVDTKNKKKILLGKKYFSGHVYALLIYSPLEWKGGGWDNFPKHMKKK
jgi:hypothetical protein